MLPVNWVLSKILISIVSQNVYNFINVNTAYFINQRSETIQVPSNKNTEEKEEILKLRIFYKKNVLFNGLIVTFYHLILNPRNIVNSLLIWTNIK